MIETERLILRKFKESDINDFFEFRCQEKVAIRVGAPVYKTIDEAEIGLINQISRKNCFAIVLKSENKVIGSISINDMLKYKTYGDIGCEYSDAREIAYMISEKYWNNGYGSEAFNAVVKYCFEVLQVKAIFACYHSKNSASGRVQERAGMKHFKTLPNSRIWRETNESCDLICNRLDKISEEVKGIKYKYINEDDNKINHDI